MIFKKIVIRNFQTHRKLILDLDEHVNCFIGATDAGKSSIIRAIRWCCLNQPTGETFISHGEDFSKVVIKLSKNTIKRKRTRGKENVYFLDSQEYKAFGIGKVPEDIKSCLNVEDINFQQQHESPFWFMNTAGEVSQELNKIVNLDLIDFTIGNVNTEVRKCRGEVKFSQERLECFTKNFNSLFWISECVENLEEVKKLEEKISKNSKSIYDLNNLHKDVEEHKTIVEYSRSSIEILTKLISYVEKYLENEKSIEKLEKYIFLHQKVKKLKNEKAHQDFEKIEKAKQEWEENCEKVKELSKLLEKYSIMEKELWERKNSVTILEKEIETQLKGKCPLCGKLLPEGKMM